jgi:hypothetical protein
MKNRFSAAVLHQGHIYGLDEAILACRHPADQDQSRCEAAHQPVFVKELTMTLPARPRPFAGTSL